MKLKKFALALGMGAVVSMPAQAIVAYNLLSMQDDDIDYVLRATTGGGYAPVTSGPVHLGDIFLSVFEFPTVTLNGDSLVGPNEEFTGVAAVQLKSITNPDGTSVDPGAGGVPLPGAIYEYDVWNDFNSFLVSQGGADLGSYASGAAVALWYNPTTDFDLDLDRAHNGGNPNCANLSDCISKAATGTLFQVDGFLGDGDESWLATQVALGGGDLDTVKDLNNTTTVASVNFALSNIYQLPSKDGKKLTPVGGIEVVSGMPCDFTLNATADGCAQVTGNVNLTGGQGIDPANEAVAHSTTINAQKYVPEPATLALFGIGLLGLGGRLRRDA